MSPLRSSALIFLWLLLSQYIPLTTALYFRLTSLVATLTTVPISSCPPTQESHYNISFTVSNPDAVWEQGGSGEFYCEISWQTPSLTSTCWHPCSSLSPTTPTGYYYYTRLSPSPPPSSSCSFNLSSFSLDVWQGYIYEIGNHNNATVVLSENSGGKGEDRWVCQRVEDEAGEEGDGGNTGERGEEEKCVLMQGEREGSVLREVGVWYGGSEPGSVCRRDV